MDYNLNKCPQCGQRIGEAMTPEGKDEKVRKGTVLFCVKCCGAFHGQADGTLKKMTDLELATLIVLRPQEMIMNYRKILMIQSLEKQARENN